MPSADAEGKQPSVEKQETCQGSIEEGEFHLASLEWDEAYFLLDGQERCRGLAALTAKPAQLWAGWCDSQ